MPRAILIKVRDPKALIRSKSAVASLVQEYAPETIEAKIYDEMQKKLREGFRAQGVDVDVGVVEPAGWQPSGGSPIWKPLAIGLGVLSVGLLGWKIFGGRRA